MAYTSGSDRELFNEALGMVMGSLSEAEITDWSVDDQVEVVNVTPEGAKRREVKKGLGRTIVIGINGGANRD